MSNDNNKGLEDNSAFFYSKESRFFDGDSERSEESSRPSNSLNCEDEYYQFENFCSETCLSSSFLGLVEQNLDFKGGLLQEISQRNLKKNPLSSSNLKTFTTPTDLKFCANNDLFITTTPSSSSKGFENTFKLLKDRIISKNQRTIKTELVNKEIPSKFDLELNARQRLYELFVNVISNHEDLHSPSSHDICDSKICSFCSQKSLIDFLQCFTRRESDEIDQIQPTCGFENDGLQTFFEETNLSSLNIIYHAKKDADGTKGLKIVKNQVLCGNRVSQMTRAYDDIEAVTRLLEEKEKDLELTVQIGKELLTQNNTLENRISELEADLKISNEDRTQLVHELNKKNELIAVLTNDADDGSEAETPTFSKSVTLDLLQKKVGSLQDENKILKMEASQLAKQTDDVEAHERQLLEDITAQLNQSNNQFGGLSLELEHQREENRLQHEQIISLTTRLAEAEMRLHQLTHDNDEHVTLLNITKENQNSLAHELCEFKQRYQEVLALLQETQEQLRKQRKRAMPQARSASFMLNTGGISVMSGSYGYLQPDSLQSELMESSILSENSVDSGISSDKERANDRIGRLMSQLGSNNDCEAIGSGLGGGRYGIGAVPPYQRVFDTVRLASKNVNCSDNSVVSCLSSSQMGVMSMSSSSGPRMSATAFPPGSFYRPDFTPSGMGKTLSCESLTSYPEENYPTAPAGVPGAPGAKDLEAALKRLTPAEVLARRAMLAYAPAGTYNYDEHQQQQQYKQASTLPPGVRTPDSIMSTNSSGISSSARVSSSVMHQWRLPEKLQIVKPMEGSQTLHHWSRLATPTLSGLLDERPGVTIRGGRGLDDLGMQIYNLEDVEEDYNEDLPCKQFEAPGCTYTYTNSMVMHPDDGFVNDLSFLSESQMSSRMASTSTSRQPSCPPTPRTGLSRKNSCSTFSVNLGLASMLNERGIKAVTPSALNTPVGPNYTPTITPCNSPEGSPTRSRSPEPLFGLLTSGADLIRRKLIGGDIERPVRNQQKQKQQKIMLSRLERRALRSLRLVEKVESIGLENIIATHPCPMSQLASGIANRSSSPISQLASLKSLHSSSNSVVNDLHFEREQIKSVLHKGLNNSNNSSIFESLNDDTLSACGSDNKEDLNAFENKARDLSSGSAQIHTIVTSSNNPTSTSLNSLSTQSEYRSKQIQRQRSRRHLKNGLAAQRTDLGTINRNSTINISDNDRVRSDLGTVEKSTRVAASFKNQKTGKLSKNGINEKSSPAEGEQNQQSYTQSFVGTVSSLLFGRKGGWL